MPKVITVEDIIKGDFLDKECKVFFRGNDDKKMPVIGKFVMLEDGENLKGKGLVRFVNKSSYDRFEFGRVDVTKIYAPSCFSLVQIVDSVRRMLYVSQP